MKNATDNTTQLVNFIRFHGLVLVVVENTGIEYIDPRPLCDLVGLQWKGAQRTLMSGDNIKLFGTRRLIPPNFGVSSAQKRADTEAQDESNGEIGTPGCPETGLVHIRFDRSRMFLARVNTNQMRVQGNGDAADFLLELQIEWAQVLHKYESGEVASKNSRKADAGLIASLMKTRALAKPWEAAAFDAMVRDAMAEMGYPAGLDPQQLLPL